MIPQISRTAWATEGGPDWLAYGRRFLLLQATKKDAASKIIK